MPSFEARLTINMGLVSLVITGRDDISRQKKVMFATDSIIQKWIIKNIR